ncbi:unnamed protein product [Parnassius apollo]|uniref:(apollo) hypothetical protein n=1 Tax=Parnassius apollo TaxID=110799 RepID=A0A8S3XXC0_PARAO|nr:unnamed protein product [Parnassius apollo]
MFWCLFLGVTISLKEYFLARHELQEVKTEIAIFSLVVTALMIDVVITLVFIVGAHKKNPKLLRVYYKYGLASLVIIFLLYLVAFGIEIFNYYYIIGFQYLQDVIDTATIGAGMLIFNLYLLSMIRSEIVKLENNTQLTFVNHVTNPQCYMENGVNN